MIDRKMLGVIAIAVLGVLIALVQPFAPGLSPLGHYVMGTVIAGLGMWIFRPGNLPFMSGTSIILGLTLALFFAYKAGLVFPGKVPFKAPPQIYEVVMGGFTSSAVWVLIPALYFGFVLQKTGLGKRIAYMVLKTFPATWLGLVISWFVIGVALSALTPSITVRVAIVVPIAIGIVEACKLEYRSQGSAFICLMAWGMALFPGTGWLTGSLSGPIMQGFFPPEIKHLCNFDDWFKILALPWFVVTLVYAALAYILARPKEAIAISSAVFKEEYKKLGPMSKDEIISILILVGSLLMFFTEKQHGIPTAATALFALFLFVMFHIITGPEISSGINWDVVCFFGIAVALPPIFGVSGISAWFGPLIKGPIMSIAGAPLLFMLVITAGLMLIRFIDVPWGFTTAALTIIMLIPLFNDFGYHPLAVTMAYLIAVNFFLLSYQQPFLLMGEGMIQGKGWAPAHVFKFGLIYIAAAFISLLVAVPYWKMIGVIR